MLSNRGFEHGREKVALVSSVCSVTPQDLVSQIGAGLPVESFCFSSYPQQNTVKYVEHHTIVNSDNCWECGIVLQ